MIRQGKTWKILQQAPLNIPIGFIMELLQEHNTYKPVSQSHLHSLKF